jgi:hypothetical protein
MNAFTATITRSTASLVLVAAPFLSFAPVSPAVAGAVATSAVSGSTSGSPAPGSTGWD